MYQTLVSIGMVGCAIVIFSERITRVRSALHRRTLGIELPRGWSRGGAVFCWSSDVVLWLVGSN